MNKLKIAVLAAAAVVPATGILLASAAGPNMIADGAFNNGVAGWDNFSGNPAHFKKTLKITNAYQGNGNSYYGAWYCVKVQPGAKYDASIDFFVPNDAPLNSGASVQTHHYASDDCSGPNLKTGGGGSSSGRFPDQRGEWQTLEFESKAPDGAHSARFRVSAFKEPKAPQTSIPEEHVVYFDNASFAKADLVIVLPELPTKTPGPQIPDGPKDISDTPNDEPTDHPQPEQTADEPADQPAEEPAAPADSDAGDSQPAEGGDESVDEPDGNGGGSDDTDKPSNSNGANGNSSTNPNTSNSAAAPEKTPLAPSTGETQDGTGSNTLIVAGSIASMVTGLALVAFVLKRRRTES